MVPSGYDSQFAMEKSTIFKFGKPSISIRAIFNSKLLNNQRVYGGGHIFRQSHITKWFLVVGCPIGPVETYPL